MAQRFAQFQERYAPHFQTKTRNNAEVAGQYLNGLVQANKRNMERMEEKVPEANSQKLQHFVTNSPWDERAVLTQVAKEADELLGGSQDSCLLIDETSFIKKGEKSVGVGRQWCGRLGKVENCQVAVFGALVNGDKAVPIDHRLFLPERWALDEGRCEGAGIPADQRGLKSKCQLATEIIETAIENDVRFRWVGADAGYGKDPKFLGDLFGLGLDFVVDVHKDQKLWVTDPSVPKASTTVAHKWATSQPEFAWVKLSPRSGTKGSLEFEYLQAKFWIKVGLPKDSHYEQVRLIVRRSASTKGDFKFTVSNVEDTVSFQRLAYMQAQRFWIERTFEDAKSGLGMDEYQFRKWTAWHHHMALVSMAHLFLLRERIHNAEALPLLSMQDVIAMLAFYLPKRDVTEEEIFRQLAARHEKRRQDMERSRA